MSDNIIKGPWKTEDEKIKNKIDEIKRLSEKLENVEDYKSSSLPILSTRIRRETENLWDLWQENYSSLYED